MNTTITVGSWSEGEVALLTAGREVTDGGSLSPDEPFRVLQSSRRRTMIRAYTAARIRCGGVARRCYRDETNGGHDRPTMHRRRFLTLSVGTGAFLYRVIRARFGVVNPRVVAMQAGEDHVA